MTVTALSDTELLGQARGGDEAAFTELYVRHQPAALRLARTYRRLGDPDELVSGAFERVLGAIRRGAGPTESFRAYLFVTLRRFAAQSSARPPGAPLDEVPEPIVDAADSAALARTDRELVTRAFESLPDQWQSVLWQTAVEGRQPRDLAPVMGVSANAAAAMAYRARERLRQAYLQAHLSASPAPDHQPYRSELGAYVRDGLSARDRRAVEGHLRACEPCRALLAEIEDVNRSLARAVLPLFLLVGGGKLGGALLAGTAAGAAGAGAAGRGGRGGTRIAGRIRGVGPTIGTVAAVAAVVAGLAGVGAMVAREDPEPTSSAADAAGLGSVDGEEGPGVGGSDGRGRLVDGEDADLGAGGGVPGDGPGDVGRELSGGGTGDVGRGPSGGDPGADGPGDHGGGTGDGDPGASPPPGGTAPTPAPTTPGTDPPASPGPRPVLAFVPGGSSWTPTGPGVGTLLLRVGEPAAARTVAPASASPEPSALASRQPARAVSGGTSPVAATAVGATTATAPQSRGTPGAPAARFAPVAASADGLAAAPGRAAPAATPAALPATSLVAALDGGATFVAGGQPAGCVVADGGRSATCPFASPPPGETVALALRVEGVAGPGGSARAEVVRNGRSEARLEPAIALVTYESGITLDGVAWRPQGDGAGTLVVTLGNKGRWTVKGVDVEVVFDTGGVHADRPLPEGCTSGADDKHADRRIACALAVPPGGSSVRLPLVVSGQGQKATVTVTAGAVKPEPRSIGLPGRPDAT